MPAVQKADRPAAAPAAASGPAAPLALVAGSDVAPVRWTYVCALTDILPNTGVCAKVGEEQVAVFRVMAPSGEEEGVFALSNLDPRADANVLSRGLVGDVGGELVVASPVYKNHFVLSSGACLEDPAYDVPTYPVRIAEGRIFVRGSAR
ncbi:MAG TPA: nitrite reductase small subunit NirD [Nevskiaceae bacterium]|nr:nitrite reductase small subunit NirD [Nevskiaceae bacterium]